MTLLLAWLACGAPPVDARQDVTTTDVALDLATLAGHATVEVRPAPGRGEVALDVHGLALTDVRVDGGEAAWRVERGWLVVPAGDDPVRIDASYTFPARTPAQFDGWMPALGASFVWPDHCGNLFPCDPAPRDGVTFSLDVTGAPDGAAAVFPAGSVTDGPPYMLGFAVGPYEDLDLGRTDGGVALTAWYRPGAFDAARRGTRHLRAAYSFFEATYGPYPFGDRAGTVQVDWGADSWGGMEHHPLVHVARWDFDSEEAQVHEAAHAWFGDGVRLACWEDFVLSEGTTTYITARALDAAGGPDVWPMYVDDFLVPACTGADDNARVLPDETCDAIDFEDDPLWSLATYMKGACFYEEVADAIGADRLDAAIGAFYRAHVGQAARMRDMIDALEAEAPEHADAIEAAASDWLDTYECPEDYAARCRTHAP